MKENKKLSINHEKCIKILTPKLENPKCMNVCPEQAISGNIPHIVKEKCKLCFFCVTHCPTGAIEWEGWNAKNIANTVNKLNGKPHISISCAFSEKETDITLPCLGALTDDMITLIATAGKSLKLFRGNCGNCRFKPPETLEKEIKRAKDRLEVCVDIEICPSEHRKEPKKNLFEKLEEEGHLYSRREVLHLAKKFTEKQELPISPVRSVLIDRKSTYVKFPHPLIENSCDFCKGLEPICVKICMTGALSIAREKETKSICVEPERCTICEACKDTCPNQAIKIEGLSHSGRKKIKTFEIHRCKSCGAEIPKELGEICPVCSLSNKVKQVIEDFLEH